MIDMTIDEARRRQGVAESALRRAKGALYEEELRAARGELPTFVDLAKEAVEDAQRRFDFNTRRVSQLEEDQIVGEVLEAKARREAARAAEDIVILPEKPKVRGKRSKTKATVTA